MLIEGPIANVKLPIQRNSGLGAISFPSLEGEDSDVILLVDSNDYGGMHEPAFVVSCTMRKGGSSGGS